MHHPGAPSDRSSRGMHDSSMADINLLSETEHRRAIKEVAQHTRAVGDSTRKQDRNMRCANERRARSRPRRVSFLSLARAVSLARARAISLSCVLARARSANAVKARAFFLRRCFPPLFVSHHCDTKFCIYCATQQFVSKLCTARRNWHRQRFLLYFALRWYGNRRSLGIRCCPTR